MQANDFLIFVDTNQYLDLYRNDRVQKRLERLAKYADCILITKQMVAEFQRNKVSVASEFLQKETKSITLQTCKLPDYLCSTSIAPHDIRQQMSKIDKDTKEVKAQVNKIIFSTLDQISSSEDEVSKALSLIFAKAIPHSSEELQKARARKELGNPPGKSNNPLGDQLAWEQILTHFKGKKRLWIVSRDEDYGKFCGSEGYLNSFLYNELCEVADKPEVYLFKDIDEAIKHFDKTTRVDSETQLIPREIEDISQKEKSLPSLAQQGRDLENKVNLKQYYPLSLSKMLEVNLKQLHQQNLSKVLEVNLKQLHQQNLSKMLEVNLKQLHQQCSLKVLEDSLRSYHRSSEKLHKALELQNLRMGQIREMRKFF